MVRLAPEGVDQRVETLNAKLEVIGDTAAALTDLIDAEKSLRLETIIVILILFEIVFGLFQFIKT